MLNQIQSASPVLWANISNGLIVIKTNINSPGAKSRINKQGTTVYENFYGSIHGVVSSISMEENKFGEKEIKVGLKSNGNDAVLTISLNSSYGRSFLAQIFNARINEEIVFIPWQKLTEEGKKKSNLYLQYGTSPSRKNEVVTYEFPKGTPEVIWVDLKGKQVVDNISQIKHIDYLEEKLAEFAKANNLVYNKTQSETTFLSPNVDTTPLTQEEMKETSAPKANKVVRGQTNKDNFKSTDQAIGDLFDTV